MGFLGNVLWFLLGGWAVGLGWVIAGALWCLTIVGIPIGVQCFKFAGLAFWPFGKEVAYGGGAVSLLANLLWLIFSGRRGAGAGVLRHHRGHPLWPAVLQAGEIGPDAFRRQRADAGAHPDLAAGETDGPLPASRAGLRRGPFGARAGLSRLST